MMYNPLLLHELLAILDEIAPFSLAAAWDNVGLMVGAPGQEVTGILIALDPTEDVLDEALANGINTIVTHHPLIFHPLKTIRTDQPLGLFLTKALAYGIAVVASHTNLDVVRNGVNDILAARLNLADTRPLAEHAADTGSEGNLVKQENGFGRIGVLTPPQAAQKFLDHLLHILNIETVSVAGSLPEMIETVAVCGGSGSDFAKLALAQGAQVYITGEIKHSTARWVDAVGFCVIDAGHFATENPIVDDLATSLSRILVRKNFQGKIQTTKHQGNPFSNYPLIKSITAQ